MRVNADSLLIRAAATSTSGTLNDLTTDLIMANNNKYHILFGLLFVDGQYAGILPCLWYMAFLPYLGISWCNLSDRLDPPYFHSSAEIWSPPGAFPSFSTLIALTISSIVGFSSRIVLTLGCYMFSSASGSMSPGTLRYFFGIHSIFPAHSRY